jgi:hypothetical protein
VVKIARDLLERRVTLVDIGYRQVARLVPDLYRSHAEL